MTITIHQGQPIAGTDATLVTRVLGHATYHALVSFDSGMDGRAMAEGFIDHVVASAERIFVGDGPLTSDDLGSWLQGHFGFGWEEDGPYGTMPFVGMAIVEDHRDGFVSATTAGDAHVAHVDVEGRRPRSRRPTMSFDVHSSGTLAMAVGPGAKAFVRRRTSMEARRAGDRIRAGLTGAVIALTDRRAGAERIREGWIVRAMHVMGVEDTPENRCKPIPHRPRIDAI